ncbi:MAG: right-handed parallel beta-helix repeat-containing protein [Candidatus Coatesbacteria bacterium]|nr:right-handed parallel beta-helix repeat-containing protein [Candidatus Coatesbacteria bacterium]
MNNSRHLTQLLLILTLPAILMALGPSVAVAAPSVGIYTDRDNYGPGNWITVSLSGQNFDYGMSVDIYIGLLTPDGGTFTLVHSGWSHYLEPWIRDIYIPNPFDMPRTPFMWYSVPCDIPPINAEGEYFFAAGLTYPGTFEFVNDISFARFFYGEAEATGVFVNPETGSDANEGTLLAPYRTITHALAAVNGTESEPVVINAGPGIYSASTNGETFPLYMESWVSLKGHGQQMSVLDAEFNAPHVIYFNNVHDCTLRGFTITGGSALQEGTIDGRGGGIYVHGTTPEIVGNEIIDNGADEGAGIYCDQSGASITGNLITDNVATRGGGIFCYAGSQAISDNNISLNYADHGGGIFFDGQSAASVEGNQIVSNFSGGKGGGVACVNASYPSIVGNLIAENEAELGGGVSCHDGGTPGLENNWLEGNEAYMGGAIYCEASEPRILNDLVIDNIATQHGGGVFCTGYGAIAVVNCTIARNASDDEGDGVACVSGCSLTVENCILWENEGDEAWTNGASIVMSHCDVEGSYSGDGNLEFDPLFVNGPLGAYYLDPFSLCIDAGSRSAADAGLDGCTTQASGLLDTGSVDLGYHYPLP